VFGGKRIWERLAISEYEASHHSILLPQFVWKRTGVNESALFDSKSSFKLCYGCSGICY
jgi:hypothetical protein